MKVIQIVKYPDRKRYAIDVYDKETNTHYTVAYFIREEDVQLFIEALTSVNYIKDSKGGCC